MTDVISAFRSTAIVASPEAKKRHYQQPRDAVSLSSAWGPRRAVPRRGGTRPRGGRRR
jgi:hypothetical protein